jgi:signal transduction histidine kinase/CheY-like chemotaxis protein
MRLFSPAPDDRIRHLQIEMLFKHAPTIYIANYLNSILIVLVMWHGGVDYLTLAAWLVVMLSLVTVRVVLTRRYWRDPRRDVRLDFWLRMFTGTTIMSGLMWGLAGVLFYVPENGIYGAFLLVVLLGIGAGATTFLSPHLPTFISYFTALMVPLIVRVFLAGDLPNMIMSGMMVIYLLVFLMLARNVNEIYLESILLRFDNLELVDKLTSEKEVAEKANLAKSKFLAAASHDLRQPLHALTLLSGALAERTESEENRNIVDKIRAAVLALENLFNALLDISKLDSGVMQPCVEEFSIDKLFKRIDNDHRPEAEHKGLQFRTGNCAGITVLSDSILLERMLRNFVTNAIRYTEDGRISLECHETGKFVNIVVRDTGIGIPQEMQEKIFDEYFQLDNKGEDRSKGLGLGLAIVARIARLLKHEVMLESTEGKGSVFRVRVPRGEGQVALAEKALQSEMMAQRRDLENLRVLLIDDELAILDALNVLLGGWGCEVMLAGSVEEARIAMWSHAVEPDAIIADYRLRDEVSGPDAVKAIEAIMGHKVPAILITGDMEVTASQADQDGYRILYKPVQPARLRAFLKHVQRQLIGLESGVA